MGITIRVSGLPPEQSPRTPVTASPTDRDRRSGNYELRHIVYDPEPDDFKDSIEVILATGDTTVLTETLCETFAHDFDCVYVNVQEYLRKLAIAYMEKEDVTQALGCLHPTALLSTLAEKKQLSEYFMTPVLLHKINQHVKEGSKRFLISGLDKQMETAWLFAQKISEPVAMISFQQHSSHDSDSHCSPPRGMYSNMRASIERRYMSIALNVQVSEPHGIEFNYRRLMAAVFDRVARACRT